jgi:hypothetical protein
MAEQRCRPSDCRYAGSNSLNSALLKVHPGLIMWEWVRLFIPAFYHPFAPPLSRQIWNLIGLFLWPSGILHA